MKTLRITAALLLAVTAAACTASPTAIMPDAAGVSAQLGTGFMGSGTRAP